MIVLCVAISFIHIPIGSPSFVYNLTVSVSCNCFRGLIIRASWDPATSNPLCGSIVYETMLSLSNGTIVRMTGTTNKFQFFSGIHVRPATHYNVTVASRNYAGVGESRTISISTPSELLDS